MELKTKTELMAAVARGEAIEAFEHSIEGWFDVTAMRKWAVNHAELEEVEVAQVASFLFDNRVIDMDRVANLTRDQYLNDPALCVVYDVPEAPGGIEHLFIDGTHRAVRLQKENIPYMKVYMIPASGIIRPSPGWGMRPDHDWGDEVVDGKIVKRT